MEDVPYLQGEHPIRFAHRGSRKLWPENTWYGFDAAVNELGYRYIETDVQITKDGVVVVFHDDTLERTTNGMGYVADWEWDDLQHLDAAHNFEPDGDGRFPLRGTGVRVSRLDDTFDRYPDTYFNIDLKAKGTDWGVAEVIARMGRQDSVLVGSFSDLRLSRFRRITRARVPIAAAKRAAMTMYGLSRVGKHSKIPVQAYQLPYEIRGAKVDRKLVDAVHAAGAHLHLWTVDDPEDMERFLALGVDGIVTDRPDLLNDVVEERKRATR